MNSVEIADQAKADLASIFETIANDNLVAADRFASRFDEVFKRLAVYPKLGESLKWLGQDLRMFVVAPYVIIYRYENKRVRVKRIFHGAQKWEDLL